jgi:hypothetical protein
MMADFEDLVGRCIWNADRSAGSFYKVIAEEYPYCVAEIEPSKQYPLRRTVLAEHREIMEVTGPKKVWIVIEER